MDDHSKEECKKEVFDKGIISQHEYDVGSDLNKKNEIEEFFATITEVFLTIPSTFMPPFTQVATLLENDLSTIALMGTADLFYNTFLEEESTYEFFFGYP